MADGVPSRPSVPPDLVHLLELMHIRSEVVESRLAQGGPNPPAIEEIPPATPSVLDHLVEARVRVEEQALGTQEDEPAGAGSGSGIEDAAGSQASVDEPEVTHGAAAALVSQPAATEIELDEAESTDDDLALLELNAFEAGQPAADLEDYEPPVSPHLDEGGPVQRTIEADERLEAAPSPPVDSEARAFQPDEPAPADAEEGNGRVDARSDLAAIQADLSRMEADLAQYEELTSQPEEAGELEEEAESIPQEGPGEDFQALLAGARTLEPEESIRAPRSGEEFPFLPADGDVRLRARNGPRPGAEFVGRSTLAGATGMFCLIHGFNLPLGTHMKVSLMAPNLIDQLQLDDAVVSRLRKAPDNATEVQLTFEAQHVELEEFVGQHFGKPSFSLFGRRRPKR